MRVRIVTRVADIHIRRCCFTPKGVLCLHPSTPDGQYYQQVAIGDHVIEANHGPGETYYRHYRVEENRLQELKMGSSVDTFKLSRLPPQLTQYLSRDNEHV